MGHTVDSQDRAVTSGKMSLHTLPRDSVDVNQGWAGLSGNDFVRAIVRGWYVGGSNRASSKVDLPVPFSPASARRGNLGTDSPQHPRQYEQVDGGLNSILTQCDVMQKWRSGQR